MLFLGLDLGTTNVKALVVDDRGTIVAQGASPVLRSATPGGGVEQDIEQIWEATCAAIAEAAGNVHVGQIGALGVSSQGGALQLLDREEHPLGPVISWLDGRGAPFDRRLEEEMGEEWLVAHTGHNLSSMTLGQLLRLGKDEPELLGSAAGIGFVGDVIVGRLCGRRAHDATSLSIGMLYNPRLQDADPQLLGRLGIRGKRLPDLVRATEAAGSLAGPVAARTGLTPAIPVSAAIHDQYAASVGAGAIGEGDVLVGTGTAWVLLATMGRLAEPIARRTFVCPHPLDGLYGQLMSLGNGGSAVQWALEITGQEHLRGEELDARLASVPPGSDGLRCWPLLMDSGRAGGNAAAGGIMAAGGRLSGIRLGHSAGHLLRAVVEGLACELARHLGWFAAAGAPIERLVVSGPAAVSPVAAQILAAVTDRPVTCVEQPDLSAFGAATIARVLAEPQGNLGRLAAALAPARRTVQPGPDGTLYGRLLAEYLAAFQ